MADEDHVERLLGGTSSWNQWRRERTSVVPDLRRAHLEGADLRGANISFADLSGAHLVGANLENANFVRANFFEANLYGANLGNAVISNTALTNLDLRGVLGLSSVFHLGPSSVGIDTIYRSNGEIPESFLLGCGVPGELITFMRSLTSRAIEFYSCFISYSTKNQDFADRLYTNLRAKGVRCWFAPHDVQGGRKLHEQIDEAIRLHDKLLLILSPDSMNSEWVKTETIKARNREIRDNARVLFPVRLCSFSELDSWRCVDTSTGTDHAPVVREFYIPDFSNWKPDKDSYQREFEKLLRDLQPAAGAAG
jgi:hypothetical protein